MGLQEGFPSTVPTIFRTGDKLQLESAANDGLKCVVCEGIVDTAEEAGQDKNCTALEATNFSKLVSQKGVIDRIFSDLKSVLRIFYQTQFH